MEPGFGMLTLKTAGIKTIVEETAAGIKKIVEETASGIMILQMLRSTRDR
jgi:hypothetical protein